MSRYLPGCPFFDSAGNIRRVNERTDCELLGDYAENGSELGKLIAEAPETIIARTDPIRAPDGKWLRVYSLADGSVHQRSTEGPDEAFAGNWAR